MVCNCFGITLELSEQKWRPEADLGKLWEANKDALLQLPLVATLGGEPACSVFAWQPASWQGHRCEWCIQLQMQWLQPVHLGGSLPWTEPCCYPGLHVYAVSAQVVDAWPAASSGGAGLD